MTSSLDDEEDEKRKEIHLQEFIAVGKKPPRFSPKNRRGQKKIAKLNESEPVGSTTEMQEFVFL